MPPGMGGGMPPGMGGMGGMPDMGGMMWDYFQKISSFKSLFYNYNYKSQWVMFHLKHFLVSSMFI
jgi:hypothetical protein